MVYMAVTPDEYELPLFICDTAAELAQRYETTKDVVYSAVSRGDTGKYRGAKFIRVEIEPIGVRKTVVKTKPKFTISEIVKQANKIGMTYGKYMKERYI